MIAGLADLAARGARLIAGLADLAARGARTTSGSSTSAARRGRGMPRLTVITRREASILAALADAVAAPEPPLPPVAATDAAVAFDAWLAAAPPRNRRALRLALFALERASGRRRFRTLDRAGRLCALSRLQRSRIPLVPQIADALRSAAVMSYHGDAGVMATLGYDAAARMREVRARRGRSAAAGVSPADAGPAPAGDDDGFLDGARVAGRRTLRADVCVIGSGAGGAVVAKELAEGGARVVVLEEGERHPAAGMTGRPRDMLARMYRDGGQIATLGRPPILLPLGRGVGGTTLVNSGTCFRTPDRVLAAWRDELGLDGLAPEALAPVFARVERTLGVAEVPAELAGANTALLRRGAELLGWSGGHLRRNAPGCRGSGVCAYGCPTGAKQHAGDAYLAPARAAGALACTGARAERIVVRGGRATGVEARTRGGGRLTVDADAVVVAAGTIHTPLLLAASGIGRGPQLGRNLSLHPATAVWGLFDEPVDMTRGVPQSYFVDEFAPDGILLEGIAGPPDYVAVAAPFAGDRHRELMLRYRHLGQCGLVVSDRSRGRVAGRPGAPRIRYDLVREDVATLHAGLVRLAELLAAAGARTLVLPLARLPELPAGDLAPLRALDVRGGDLGLMAFHPLGTARAHSDPAHGVLDGDLRVRGTEHVFVADGSAVPTPLGVNPQITIMALATRLAFHLRSEPCPS